MVKALPEVFHHCHHSPYILSFYFRESYYFIGKNIKHSLIIFATDFIPFLNIGPQVTGKLNLLVRISTEVETNIVAVERIGQYTKVPNEVCHYY